MAQAASSAFENIEPERQAALRTHRTAQALAIGQSYAALHPGLLDTYVQRMCLGPGEEGTYFLTLFADPTNSGDGRLSASADGYLSTLFDKGAAVIGVDVTGWHDFITGEPGCWCCSGGTCGTCLDTFGFCQGKSMPPSSGRMVRGYVMRVTHLSFEAGLVSGGSELQGCISYGQWRYYEVRTNAAADAHLYAAISAPVGALVAAEGRCVIARPRVASWHPRRRAPSMPTKLGPCPSRMCPVSEIWRSCRRILVLWQSTDPLGL